MSQIRMLASIASGSWEYRYGQILTEGSVYSATEVPEATATAWKASGLAEAYVAAGGGGAMAPAKNAVAHADDDDFGSDKGDYTDVNWSGQTTVDYNATVPGALFVKHPVSGSTTHRCRLRALPSGDWSLVLDLTAPSRNSAGLPVGLYLTDGVTAGAGNQTVLALTQVSNVLAISVPRYTNFTTFGAFLVGSVNWPGGQRALLRLDRIGGVYTAYFGAIDPLDGTIHWTSGDALTPTGTPSHFGIGYASSNTGHVMAMAFHGLWVFAGGYPANGVVVS